MSLTVRIKLTKAQPHIYVLQQKHACMEEVTMSKSGKITQSLVNQFCDMLVKKPKHTFDLMIKTFEKRTVRRLVVYRWHMRGCCVNDGDKRTTTRCKPGLQCKTRILRYT